MHGRLGAVETLVKAGASVNRKDVQGGFTPMHLAADAGQCEAMEALLRAGGSLNPRSTQGWTPLGLATLKVLLVGSNQGLWALLLSIKAHSGAAWGCCRLSLA